MTPRGRITLVVLAALLVGAPFAVLRLAAPPDGTAVPEHADPPDAPAVSGPPPPPAVPASLLAAVPSSRAEADAASTGGGALVFPWTSPDPAIPGPIRLETSLDAELTRGIWRVLERGRVALGHVLVLDVATGRLLAYASTDVERFPPDRPYPAASLIKIVTAAAALDREPDVGRETCRYQGNPWRLSRRQVDPPRRGRSVSVARALAQSNNQCFAQLAVHRIGASALIQAIDAFGFLMPPAPGHPPGEVEDPGEDRYALGLLGSGLDGTWITPLHAVQLAAVLADGVRREPTWLARAEDAAGRELRRPPARPPERVMTRELADELREMLVETTRRGTARRAFRTRRGRPLLQGIEVAGKTGSLSGSDPDGRYEWFAGVAPAGAPRIAVATVAVQGDLYWLSASQLGAEVLKLVFCPEGVCRAEAAARFAPPAAPDGSEGPGAPAEGRDPGAAGLAAARAEPPPGS